MSDKLFLDSNLMEAAAFGIFDAAPDADTARAALVAEYNKYNWTDPAKALKTVEDYGLAIKQKYADTSEFNKEFLVENAPVTIADANKALSETGEPYDINDVYTKWEQDNLKILETTDNPIYAVARQQYMRDIPKVASEARRGYNIENRDQALGPVLSLGLDSLQRFTRGVGSILNAPLEAVTGWSLNDRQTEYTDPKQDDTFSSDLIEGVGSGVGSVGALAVNPVVGTGLLIGQGTEAVVDRYQDTKYETGSPARAKSAAAVEAVSQGLQVAGEKLVFGKIAKVATGKLPGKGASEVASSMLTEAGAEGGGQLISNVSENIQNQQALTTDVGRGVGRAATVGAFTAGGLSAVANAGPTNPKAKPNKVISETDSGIRAKEIEDFGAPLTPITKQEVGPVNITPQNTNTVGGLADIGVTPASEYLSNLGVNQEFVTGKKGERVKHSEGNLESLDDSLIKVGSTEVTVDGKKFTEYTYERTRDVILPESMQEEVSVEVEPIVESSFITEDGSLYKRDKNGLVYKESVEGKTEDPFDYVRFVTEDTADTIVKGIKEGKQFIPGQNGTLLMETVEGEKKTLEPVETVDSAAEGLIPVSYSQPRKTNKDQIVRPFNLGKRIKKVELPSIGAAGNTITEKETRYGERLRKSPELPEFMREKGEAGIFYRPISFKEIDGDIEDLNDNGLEGLLEEIQDTNVPLVKRRRLGALLHNALQREATEALNAQELDRIPYLDQIAAKALPIIAKTGVEAGQALAAGKGMENLTVIKSLKVYNDTLENEIIAEAEADGIDPLLIGESEAMDLELDREIPIAEAEAKLQQEREVIKDATEIEDLDNVIQAIELDAQEKLDTDLATIANEEQALQDDIKRTEKKANKKKEKDIAVLEEAIAADNIELVNSIELGKEISETVGEEVAQTEEQVKASLDSAAEKTNSLVKQAVAAERKRRDLEKKSLGDQLKARVDRANTAYNNLKTRAATRLTNLKTQLKLEQTAGNIANATELQVKIDDVNQKLVESADRLAEAKSKLQEYNESLTIVTEAEAEVENTLEELDSGVNIEIIPTSRTRRISVKTRRSGIDVTKLFKRGEAAGPLSALSQGINNLADTFKQGSTVKNKNSSRIKELNDRISKNKSTLEKAKQTSALNAAEAAKIEKARKRLELLANEKQKATLESRMSTSNKKKYDTYKKIRSERPARADKSERLKALEDRVKGLKEQKEKVKVLKEKKQRAKVKAAEAAAKVAEVATRAAKLEQAIKSSKLNGTVLARAKADLAVLKGMYETDQSIREQLEKYFIVQMIGGVYGTLVGTTSAIIYVGVTSAQLTFPTLHALVNNMTNSQKMKYPLIAYLGGLTDKTALRRGVMIAKGALLDGIRLTSTLDRSEVIATDLLPSDIKRQDKTKPKDTLEENSWQDQTVDYYNYTKSLPEATNFLEWIARTAQIFSGRTSGLVIRAMVASESITYALHDSGYDRATAAYYHNKVVSKRKNLDSDISKAENNLKKVKDKNDPKIKELEKQKASAEADNNPRKALQLTGKIARLENKINEAQDALNNLKAYKVNVDAIGEGKVTDQELLEYMYDPEANWAKAQKEAEQEVKDLKELGIDVIPAEQNVIAVQKYHAMRPKEVQIDVYKQAARINLNAPAGGYSGLIAGWLEGFLSNYEMGGIRPAKYLLPLANSIAQLMTIAASVTPLGGAAILLDTKRKLYTDMERQIGISASVTGTSIGAGIALMALSQLDLPEDERWFDLIGGYSRDRNKRDAFVQTGGLLYSMKIGNVYIPFSETPFVLLLGAAASVVDKVRDNEEPDMTVASGLMWAAMSSFSSFTRMSMLRGLSDIEAALNTGYRQGPDEGATELGKILLGKVKIMIPSSGLLRNIAQYTDNPVDAKKDFQSAIVSGLPGVQSIFGRPLLDIFGEPLPSKGEELVNGGMSLHRIFSTKRDDVDKRWLVNSGYSIPLASEYKPKTSNTTIEDVNKLRYDILKSVGSGPAGSEIRAVVSRFRERYGNSAYNPEVQKILNSQIRDIFAREAARLTR